MAFSILAQFPAFPSTNSGRPVTAFRRTVAKPTTILSKPAPAFPQIASKPRKFTNIPKASTEDENANANAAAAEERSPAKFESDEMTELGKEIKQAMKEREGKGSGFMSGVIEEVKEIEWPAFNKVLGTTGVVPGVIAGSSVVLLTVNAVFAEISDRLFAGKGVQDFFG